jgi:alkanesulfonate monooxygenase SsuD/methylene tetrahydromethanopterin reductase-like flavin-dependent oxidoreductase (luciferase family)
MKRGEVTHPARGHVLNLPLRLPTLIAKSVASLEVLGGGRVELGIGAGAF